MDEVILARHGESELSFVGTVNGDPAVACALTAAGEEQARRLGERLADVDLDLCVTSEFERVRQTADLALAGRVVPRVVIPELNEVRFGRFEGGTLVDYREWAAANASRTFLGICPSPEPRGAASGYVLARLRKGQTATNSSWVASPTPPAGGPQPRARPWKGGTARRR